MWLWIIPILIFFVPLILAWKTAGRKMKKYILIANCIGVFIIIAMILLCVVDANRNKRDEEKYDIVQGDFWDFVYYVGDMDGYHIIGSGRSFPPKAISVEDVEVPWMCYPGADVELYYKKGTGMQRDTEVNLSDGTHAYYDGNVVAIKFNTSMFACGIIGWVVLFLFSNSIVCLLIAVAVKVHKDKLKEE